MKNIFLVLIGVRKTVKESQQKYQKKKVVTNLRLVYRIRKIKKEGIKMEYTMENKVTKIVLEDKIQEAKKLLRENGYVIIKLTQAMKDDLDECDMLEGDKDCSSCSCSVCIVE